jgi:hypothetical protein
MIKIIYFSMLTLFSTANASLLHEDVNIETSKKEAAKYPAVCKILTQHSKGYGTGTGTLCETKDGRKFILTAAHVITDKEKKSLHANVKIEFSDGTLTPMLKSTIHDAYFLNSTANWADMGLIIPNAIPSTITPMQIGDAKEFDEKGFVTSIGFGHPGTFNDSGRGFYLCESDVDSRPSLAVHMNVQLKTPITFIDSEDLKDSILERVKSPNILPLEGALSGGGSGGPVIQNNRVFATNTAGATDLIELCFPNSSTQKPYSAIYNVVEKEWGEKLGKTLGRIEDALPITLKILFRRSIKYFLGIPDFSVNIFQSMTFINETKRNWIEKTVDELLSNDKDAHSTVEETTPTENI